MTSDDVSMSRDTSAQPRSGTIYPLVLEPLLVERIWGADSLWRSYAAAARAGGGAGRSGPDAAGKQSRAPIGEIWLLCDDNLVLNGSFAGRRVVEVIAGLGGQLLGTANLEAYGTKLALLAKFLDAAQDLSIQVHPDDDYALANEAATGHLGKAEAWYVIAADPGAQVVWGFTRAVSAAEVRAAVADATLGDHLNRVPVVPGDVIVNPAGTVHAVGAGLQLFEIQQASDLTYRLYDYARRDAAGQLRELHLDKALEVADLNRADPAAGLGGVAVTAAASGGAATSEDEAGWRLLVETPQFTLESGLVGRGTRSVADAAAGTAGRGGDVAGRAGTDRLDTSTSPRSFDLLVCVTGAIDVEPLPGGAGAAFDVVSLTSGGAALVPAALGPYRLTGAGEVLRSRVGSGG